GALHLAHGVRLGPLSGERASRQYARQLQALYEGPHDTRHSELRATFRHTSRPRVLVLRGCQLTDLVAYQNPLGYAGRAGDHVELFVYVFAWRCALQARCDILNVNTAQTEHPA